MMTLDFPTFSCTDKLVHRNIQRVSPRKVGKYEIQKYSKANAADLSNVEFGKRRKYGNVLPADASNCSSAVSTVGVVVTRAAETNFELRNQQYSKTFCPQHLT